MNNIKERIEDLENRVSALEKALSSSSSFFKENEKGQRPPALREFLNEKGSKLSNINMILAIAVYRDRFIRPKSCFNIKDISDLVGRAKLKKQSNINYSVLKNVQKGYVEEDGKGEDGKKKWRVTQSGKSFVNANFKSDKKHQKKN